MLGLERPLLGSGLVVVASAFFSTAGLFVQLASREVSSWMAVFAGFAVGGLIMIPFILVRRGTSAFSSPNRHLLVIRSVVAVLQIAVLFKALETLSLFEAMLLRETAPLWVPVLSRMFLGERMPAVIWLLLLCGFAGVGLVLHPKFSALGPGDAYGLAAGGLFAAQSILTRRLNQVHEPHDRMLFFIFGIGIIGTALPAAYTYIQPSLFIVAFLLLAGLLMFGSTICLVFAFGHAPAWLLAPLAYTAVVFSALLDWAVFDRIPSLLSLAGMVLVIGSGVLIIRFADNRERTPTNRVVNSKKGD